jgi:hypothetical protein
MRHGVKLATETHPFLPPPGEELSVDHWSPPEAATAGWHYRIAAPPPPHQRRVASVGPRLPLLAQRVAQPPTMLSSST